MRAKEREHLEKKNRGKRVRWLDGWIDRETVDTYGNEKEWKREKGIEGVLWMEGERK